VPHLAEINIGRIIPSSEAKMRRKNDFLLQSVGGQDFLVPLGAKVMDLNGMIVLNAAGRYVWELLAEERVTEDLAAAVALRFEVDKETAQDDVQAFLDEISQRGLLET
jgi:hypothetical protein